MTMSNDNSYTWHTLRCAYHVLQQFVSDLPGKDGWTVQLVALDPLHHGVGGDAGLGAADGLGADGAGLVVPASRSNLLIPDSTVLRCFERKALPQRGKVKPFFG